MSDIISVQDLNLWYGNHQALHHINMEIPEKSITAFIGPSGCGKSTLLKTLNRMNDLVKGVRITGNVFYLWQDIYAPEVEVSEPAAADRHGIPEAESFSDEHIR